MQKTLKELFGVNLSAKVEVKTVPEVPERVPAISPNQVFDEQIVAMTTIWYLCDRSGLYLYGPTGSGKSSFVRQYMARLNRSVFEFHATPQSEPAEFRGGFQLQGGNTVWVDGPLTAAARAGAVLLVDELDTLNPGCAMVLKSVLDGGPVALPEVGEYVLPKEGFRVVATGNTAGNGDAWGRYASVRRQNIAVMDCFAKIEVPYMPQALEGKLLQSLYPQIPAAVIDGMVSLADAVRKLFVGADDAPPSIDVTISTRDLIRSLGYFSILTGRKGKALPEHVIDALAVTLPLGENPALKKTLAEVLQRTGFQ
jgi:cobaltochelatase CobS